MTDPPSLIQAAQDVIEWAAQTGGWEAPCWERLRKALRQAASAQATDAQEALRHIYDLLYLDIDSKGEFYSPDKPCYVVRCSYVGSLFLFSCRKP